MAESLDVDALKRRGRRRLIGAIALMLIAVIVLPMVFDAEPRSSAPPVNVRIPDEEASAFKPRVLAKAPADAVRENAVPSAPAPSPELPSDRKGAAPAPTVLAAPLAPAATKSAAPPTGAAAKPGAPKVGTAAAPVNATAKPEASSGADFVIPVAAFADPDKLKSVTTSLAGAKIPYFTEIVPAAKGPVTRVRAGPFASRESADQGLAKLKALGLKPGNVIARGG